MAECNGYEYGARIKALEKSVDGNSEQHEKIYSRIGVLETQNGITNNQFHQIMGALKEMKAEIKETNEEIKEIKDKPAKRWDTMVNTALQWIVVAILAATVVLK